MPLWSAGWHGLATPGLARKNLVRAGLAKAGLANVGNAAVDLSWGQAWQAASETVRKMSF